ncbi:hypothetical protein [Lonsdalea quercina]|uniref:hypothetical protein n=1 Tax=Lonsdalea quercina TaxID=71657 RepID=UPI003976E3B1
MRDVSRFWIGQAGLVRLNVSWRTANDFDLAGLSCWHALHPEDIESQSLRIATCPYACENIHIAHHPTVVETIRDQRQHETDSLLYLHTGLAKECKTALLPNFIWQTGHYSEVLGLSVDQPMPGWSELQLAAAMAQEYGGCWLVLDAITRFTPRPKQALSHVLYLHFTSEAATRDAGGWRWDIAAQPEADRRSLTDWLTQPAAGDVLLDAVGEHPPITLKVEQIMGRTCR